MFLSTKRTVVTGMVIEGDKLFDTIYELLSPAERAQLRRELKRNRPVE